jgi:hypothetical protein
MTFDFDIDLFHVLSPLAFGNGMEGAACHTGAALDALRLIDDVRLFARDARNTRDRAVTSAFGALLALSDRSSIASASCKRGPGTSYRPRERDILPGICHRRKNRVGGGLA